MRRAGTIVDTRKMSAVGTVKKGSTRGKGAESRSCDDIRHINVISRVIRRSSSSMILRTISLEGRRSV
jgi:hypothetical protein